MPMKAVQNGNGFKSPKHLKPATRRWIQRIYDEYHFEEDGSVTKLIAAGQAWDRAEQARAMVDKEGPTVTNKYGETKTHPAVNIQRDFTALFLKTMRELNLSEEPPDNRPPKLKYGG